MRKPKQGLAIFFTALLIGNFAMGFTMAAEGNFPQQNAKQQMSKAPCGPDCKCGCREGGPCHCASNPKGCPTASNACSPIQYSTPTPSYQSQIAYAYEDNSCETCDCCNGGIGGVDPRLTLNEPCCCGGIWMPEDPPLFRPFMADPREVTYSVGWRFNDNAIGKNIIDVSFGDSFAIYRWCDVGPCDGQLQIELEGAVWAIFNPLEDSSPLINADYYVGVPITYSFDNWQFRLRGYHISSHIGDEFLLDHPGFDRRNASAEYLDFFVSNDLTEEIRLFAGIGYVVAQDSEFKIKPFYSAFGAELRLLRAGFFDQKDMLYGCPIYAMYFRQNGEFKRHIDATYILGYEFGKLVGLYRKLRFFMEYHDGYSVEGQFFKTPTNYFSLRMSYGF